MVGRLLVTLKSNRASWRRVALFNGLRSMNPRISLFALVDRSMVAMRPSPNESKLFHFG